MRIILISFLFYLNLFSSFLSAAPKSETAIFGGGCFWCMESQYEGIKGISSVISGYTGGHTKNPTYEEICSGNTGHTEAIQISFDPAKISYSELLEIFWRQIDPTDSGGQFADRGGQYHSAIFYMNEEQKKIAEKSKADLGKMGKFKKPIVTEIAKASIFYPAEEYHQDYYKKSALRYKMYRSGSGRDQFLESVWGKIK